jgi:hypothetical protein
MIMTFEISLTRPPLFSDSSEGRDAPEDFTSLIIDGCSLLEEAGCRFLVSGFGQGSWPVDVRYDLSTVMEQLVDVLADLRAEKESELDFYGQGIERVLDFFPGPDGVRIRCRSGTAWEPNPTVEHASTEDLQRMFVRLAVDFAEALALVSPDLARVPPIPAWRRGDL